jgi:1-acyl-sn-glycerol-3-phosphate acyltransferase
MAGSDQLDQFKSGAETEPQKKSMPLLGDAVPKRGNLFTRAFASTVLRLGRWRIEGQLPNLPKFVIVGAPHTSNWDYILTMLAIFALGGNLHYVAKHTVFKKPMGTFFRWLGGVGVDRRKSHGFVQQMVDKFESRTAYILAIMPEGTRSKVRKWRSGFYFIALGAGVPIMLVAFDYGKRRLLLGPTIQPSGEYDSDLKQIQSYYVNIKEKNP